MDLELRTVLLIVGILVIAAILIHGLIGIRKANKPVDISHIDLKETDDKGNILRDGSGFDRHGVGVARVKELTDASSDQAALNETFPSAKQQHESVSDSPELVNEPATAQVELGNIESSEQEELNTPSINFDVALDEPLPSINPVETQEVIQELIQEPVQDVSRETPVFASPIVQEKESFQKVVEPTMNVPDDERFEQASVKSPTVNQEEAKEALDVLVLNVVPSDNEEINGAALLPTLLTLGFKFGEMDIFHRHVDANGQGEVLFSLVNMVQPGTFDVDNMEQFTTTGISLFMTLPHANGNMETFNIMLNAAAKIAEQFDGQVLDGDRSTLTKQSTQHYVQRIKEVERKMLLVK